MYLIVSCARPPLLKIFLKFIRNVLSNLLADKSTNQKQTKAIIADLVEEKCYMGFVGPLIGGKRILNISYDLTKLFSV